MFWTPTASRICGQNLVAKAMNMINTDREVAVGTVCSIFVNIFLFVISVIESCCPEFRNGKLFGSPKSMNGPFLYYYLICRLFIQSTTQMHS